MPFLYNVIMKLNVVSPYNDSKLVFNKETNRYELSMEFVKNEFEITFRDDGVLEKRIKKNSRKIYNFIKYRSYTYNEPVIDFCLNQTEEGRKFLFDVLLEEMEADLESGYNDLSSQPAINFANGSDKNRHELAKNQVSVDAEQVIERNGAYFGFNLLIQTRFPPSVYVYIKNLGAK